MAAMMKSMLFKSPAARGVAAAAAGNAVKGAVANLGKGKIAWDAYNWPPGVNLIHFDLVELAEKRGRAVHGMVSHA
jgi:hypothetical protein